MRHSGPPCRGVFLWIRGSPESLKIIIILVLILFIKIGEVRKPWIDAVLEKLNPKLCRKKSLSTVKKCKEDRGEEDMNGTDGC